MEILRDHLPGKLKHLPWSVVFIGDPESPISAVARSVSKISLRDKNMTQKKMMIAFPTSNGESLPIAWSAVDPVRSSITYTVRKFG